MKSGKIWANLAVDDVERTAAFYEKLGFRSNMSRASTELTSFLFGANDFVIHFFQKEKLEKAMGQKSADLKSGSEIMFSLSAESEDEVRQWADNAKEAGGSVFRKASVDENGYYYCGFADPDSHMFNVLYVHAGM